MPLLDLSREAYLVQSEAHRQTVGQRGASKLCCSTRSHPFSRCSTLDDAMTSFTLLCALLCFLAPPPPTFAACNSQFELTFFRDYVNLPESDFHQRLDEWALFCEQHDLGNITTLKDGERDDIRKAWENFTQFLPITSCALRKGEVQHEAQIRARLHILLEQMVQNIPACNASAQHDAREAATTVRVCLDVLQIVLLSLFSFIWYCQNRRDMRARKESGIEARSWDTVDC